MQMLEMKRTPLGLILLTAVLLSSSWSPLWASELSDGLSGYSVLSWTDGDGRSLGNVYAIAQTSDGYLWIGADAGLLRFDGARFAHWESLSTTELPHAAVTALAASRDGTLWVGFADSLGVRHVGRGKELPISDDGRGRGVVDALAEQPDGSLWVAMGRSLFTLGPQHWNRIPVPTANTFGQLSGVVNVRVQSADSLWLGTTDGAYEYAPVTREFQKVSKPTSSTATTANWIWDVAEGRNGTLWLTDMATAFNRRSSHGEWSHPHSPVMGYRVIADRAGNVWIGTVGEGLWRVGGDREPRDWNIERITLSSGLTSDSVRSVFEDRDGNVWVGTTVGLHRLTRRRLSPVTNVGLAVSVDAARDGRVFIGTSNSLIVLPRGARDLDRRRVIRLDKWVTRVVEDSQGSFWMVALDGVYRLDGDRLVPLRGRTLNQSNRVMSMAFDGAGNGWFIGTTETLLWRNGELTSFDVAKEWGLSSVSSAFVDHRGRLWVVSTDGKLGVRTVDGAFRLIGASEGFGPSRTVYAMYEDREGALWLGTDAGLGALVDDHFTLLDKNVGALGARIGAIVDDRQGFLWLNSEPGLLRAKRSDLLRALRDHAYHPSYTIYDSSDGLAGASIVNLRAARAVDGFLWFIRGGGLTVIDPASLREQPEDKSPAIGVDLALADVRKFEAVDGVALPPGLKTLQINYAALDLDTANKLQFRYRLDGFDRDWIEVGGRRQAIYTNLPPREYRFNVQARADGGSWSEAATWRFALPPTFFQSRVFYGVSVAGLVLAAWVLWRLRLRVVQHEFSVVLAERTRVSREIHDTLLQSLVGLTLQLTKLTRLITASPSQAAAMATRMQEQVEMYIRDARVTIFDLRSPALATRGLFAALDEFGRRATSDHGIVFESRIVGAERRLAANIETQLLRVAQEAITNAVRHAAAHRILLEMCVDGNVLTLRVRDDGRGFDSAAYERSSAGHYGITQMKERADEIGAGFRMVATPGGGTLVEVELAVGHKAYAPGEPYVA